MCNTDSLANLGRKVDEGVNALTGVHLVKEGERTEDVARANAAPPATAPATAPTATDQKVEEAGANEYALARLRKGRRSTILTGTGLGNAPGARKTLLGSGAAPA